MLVYLVADTESTQAVTEIEDDSVIDLSLLKELGKNALVNALNSVCREIFT